MHEIQPRSATRSRVLPWHGPLLALVLAACVWGIGVDARAVTPDSPEVRKVVDKAFAFLETAEDKRLGGKCLIGLAFVKDGKDEAHGQVAAAVAACQAATKGEPAAIQSDIYSTGIAIIFLCSLNPSKYNEEINKLLKSLELRQKIHGGWGYPNKDTGDTSMTQYAVLSAWEVSKVGFAVDLPSMERVADWLLRTQDPDGNWGYQGRVADSGRLIKQDSARNAMTAAGLGSTYIVADLLQLTDPPPPPDPTLPAALKLVRQGAKREPLTEKVSLKSLQRATKNGNDWMRKKYKIDPDGFTHYYLYALERYQSFQELAEGRAVKEPKWYNDGFAFLRRTQDDAGSWNSKAGPGPDTAFGVLFLLRSTKKSIDRSRTLSGGALLAGRGLPGNIEQVEIRGHRIVAKEPDRSVTQLLDDLDKPESSQRADLLADPEQLISLLQNVPASERVRYLARLQTLAVGSTPEVRELAVRTLGRLRELETAPTLIAALADPDWRVVRAADDGLFLVSRGVGSSSLGDGPSEKDRSAAVRRWRGWLAQVRPDLAKAIE
jgi:hypothetical protein